MHLDDLLDSELALPSIPRAVAMVLSELDSPDPDLRAISQHINTDIGLTTRLLALANSAQYQLAYRIGSVSDALAVLGLNQVRALTTAAAMSGAFKNVPGLDMQQFWTYSLNVAKLSRKLARNAKANSAIAFTAGLVHASGELVMHVGMPEQMAWLNDRVGPLSLKRAKAEHQLLGYTYAEVGAGFAKHWKFPLAIVEAIEHQRAPFDNKVYEALAGVVHLSSWRARAQEAGYGDAQLTDSFPDEVALALGMDIDEVMQRDPIDWTSQQESAGML
ncbi:HDOD domain-containing protein [Rhodoferax aquaticus]|uniref:HDOD domain-containing protein n=2 Tax=Rhodoferax aquaticus TaxID=2527691 RepID=A0A515EVC4_9BURK|nr:HDOD domain-containing protein [Rhodoferax aquaticus]QDL56640.1 HDOD domain-containing protein [Rhodoferax aquaticus]